MKEPLGRPLRCTEGLSGTPNSKACRFFPVGWPGVDGKARAGSHSVGRRTDTGTIKRVWGPWIAQTLHGFMAQEEHLSGNPRLKWWPGVNGLSSSIHSITIGAGDPEWKHLLPPSQKILPQMETTGKKSFCNRNKGHSSRGEGGDLVLICHWGDLVNN